MQVNRELIIGAALDLLNSYGLADTTMRRVAGQLGVVPGALYWHIDNKQGLIAAMAQQIISPLRTVNPQSGPREGALALHDALSAYRDGAEVVTAAASQPHSDIWQQLVTTMASCLAPTLDPAQRMAGARAIVHIVLGATVRAQTALLLATASPDASDDDPIAEARADISAAVTVIVAGLAAVD